MRKRFVPALLFGLCVLGFSAGAQEERPRPEFFNGQRLEIPDLIPRTQDSEYIPHAWISVRALVDAAGFTIDVEHLNSVIHGGFGDRVKAAHEKALAAFNEGTEPPPFIPFTWSAIALGGDDPPPATLQQLIDSSSFVAVGVVEESVGGFAHGMPANFLRIRIERWSGRDETPARDEVLLLWSGGEVKIGHATVLGSLQDSPQPPRVGQKVVLFPELGWDDSEFLSFNGSRSKGLGAAAKFTDLGIQVTAQMAQHVPAVARAGSFDDFAAQLEVAISRSPLR